MASKTCGHCGTLKVYADFFANRSGRMSVCKVCTRAGHKGRRVPYREEIQTLIREHHEAISEDIREARERNEFQPIDRPNPRTDR